MYRPLSSGRGFRLYLVLPISLGIDSLEQLRVPCQEDLGSMPRQLMTNGESLLLVPGGSCVTSFPLEKGSLVPCEIKGKTGFARITSPVRAPVLVSARLKEGGRTWGLSHSVFCLISSTGSCSIEKHKFYTLEASCALYL